MKPLKAGPILVALAHFTHILSVVSPLLLWLAAQTHTHIHTRGLDGNHYVHSRCQCVWLSNIGHDFGGEISCCCCVAHCQLAAASDREKCAVFSHRVYPAKGGALIQPHSASLIGTENWFNVFSCYPPTVWGPTAAVAAAFSTKSNVDVVNDETGLRLGRRLQLPSWMTMSSSWH